ncbi:LTA synthase family protein [bacterium D16-51]|nr:LTA synthase family protein [bacterium D16-59]RKI61924.1 LTA synthase family protein [bacterium D16-51]
MMMAGKKEWGRLLSYALRYIGVPVVLELVIESLNRKSVTGCIQYMLERPLLFIFNTLIIMLTVSIALFFKREIFVFTTISVVWLIFGIVNFVILQFRVTPFSAVDITLLESAISVSGHYLNPLNIAMIFLAAVVVVVSIICLYRKAPKHTHTTQKKIIVSLIAVSLIAFAIFFLRYQSNSVQALATNYTNISEAYENYGFVYCFTNSILDTGIGEPEDYSEERVDRIISSLPGAKGVTDKKPNIIFIQLESFFDVDEVKKLKLSKDAIPNFHKLQKKYSNGLLTVPTVGAGTVNTEFEVLTGMSQRDFGTSEYPYKTVLRNTTAESVCYDLKKLGYRTHCVHNNEGTFYGRNKVFVNLGFDTFTSMEFMDGLEDNPNGWKKDRILTGEIIDTLDSTKGPDFTLGITVQSHGKYQGFEVENALIQVLKAPDEDLKEAYQYYVNQLYEVDQMIGDLVKALEKRKEDTILVLYGDHLPSLDMKKEDLHDSNLYQTQYVIWDNMGLSRKEKNIASYQLYPEVLERAGIHEGNITRFHQEAEWKTKSYHEDLKVLEYDMLYGEKYAFKGLEPYQPTELLMGTEPVKVDDVVKNEQGYLMTGSNFTPYSHVLFDGEELSIDWIDSGHIQILDEIDYDEEEEEAEETSSPEPGEEGLEEEKEDIPDAFFVQIQSDGGTVLAESEVLLWKETSAGKTEMP